MKQEDKRRIAARLFLQDNPDEYEDYHEALAEFISGKNQSDKFIDFCVEPILQKKDGHILVMNDLGHVASVRVSDGFFEPLTEMTEEYGEELESTFYDANDKYPDADEVEILEKIGWRQI